MRKIFRKNKRKWDKIRHNTTKKRLYTLSKGGENMNYVKKMCILRQVKQGFSGDGKALSGLIKLEQYGKNLAAEVSVINFAPLLSGEYYCILADTNGVSELLPLRGKSFFNILSDMDISDGFCGVICFVKGELIPIAYGVNGNGVYDFKKLITAVTPNTDIAEEEPAPKAIEDYDDERVSTENYYENKENDNERELFYQASGNARPESTAEIENAQTGVDLEKNEHADGILHPFKTDSDGYYQSIKAEMDELMEKYPRDNTLQGAFSCSEWVRVKGEEGAPEYLVGVVYFDGRAKYVCYALAAKDKNAPPKEIASACTFVPTTPFDDNVGFFVIFQSAATGECIKPQKV